MPQMFENLAHAFVDAEGKRKKFYKKSVLLNIYLLPMKFDCVLEVLSFIILSPKSAADGLLGSARV